MEMSSMPTCPVVCQYGPRMTLTNVYLTDWFTDPLICNINREFKEKYTQTMKRHYIVLAMKRAGTLCYWYYVYDSSKLFFL